MATAQSQRTNCARLLIQIEQAGTLQKQPEQRSLADFCELRLLLHPELSSVQQLRALRQASLRDRNDLRDVIAAVQKVPKHFRNLGRIRLSLAPFESRTEVIDGVPWARARRRLDTAAPSATRRRPRRRAAP